MEKTLRITEITEVSIPGIDATVIVDVFDPELINHYSKIVSISTCNFQKQKIKQMNKITLE